jgi:hypothetical protein
MEDRLQTIFDETPEDEPRSKLEPYRELILRWRRQGRSYRRICTLLAEKCGVQIGRTALHEFVQRRSRPRKPEPEAEPLERPAAVTARVDPPPNGVDRYAAMREAMRRDKETPVVLTAKPKLFEYTDETQPFVVKGGE